MAVVSSKLLFQNILKSNCSLKCILPVLRTSSQFSTSPANYFDKNNVVSERMSRAMRAYQERVKKHEEFIMEQLEEFNLGKKHLANMMGKNAEEMTQAEIDEAINYLLPSGLFVPKSRPMMKPPEEIFPKQKTVEFDYSGRPYHFLFYTTRPNFSQLLHDAAKQLEALKQYEKNMQNAGDITSPRSLTLSGTNWLSQEALEKKLLEKVYTVEYEKFVEVFDRIASHPYSAVAEEFIKKYRTELPADHLKEKSSVDCLEDGSLRSRVERAARKSSRAKVNVIYPGTGKIKINNLGIDYFSNINCRQQVMMIFMYEGKKIEYLNC